MPRNYSAILCLTAALVLGACTEPSVAPLPPDEEAGLLRIEGIDPAVRPEPAADPDFAIHLPPVPGTPDIAIYDLQNGYVYGGPAQNGNLLLNVHGGGIYDAADTEMLCLFAGDQLLETGPIADVLYSAHPGVDAIYDGDSRVRRFMIKRDQVYDARPRKDELIATTTEDLSRMSVERKLLVAALLSAKCGAPPLPTR